MTIKQYFVTYDGPEIATGHYDADGYPTYRTIQHHVVVQASSAKVAENTLKLVGIKANKVISLGVPQ